MPSNVTGLATLRTTWTRKGVLSLTSGVIDPGWDGPLSTALVNFSKTEFTICLGMPFFRVVFISHQTPNNVMPVKTDSETYRRQILENRTLYSDNFLTMDTLSAELSEKIFGLPRWGVTLARIGIGAAFLAILSPILWSIYTSGVDQEARIALLERQIEFLEREIAAFRTIENEVPQLPIPLSDPTDN